MDTPNIHIDLTVEDVLQQWPQAFSVFMDHKTKCTGCFMQRFCTLRDVAETYGVFSEDLIAEIKNLTS